MFFRSRLATKLFHVLIVVSILLTSIPIVPVSATARAAQPSSASETEGVSATVSPNHPVFLTPALLREERSESGARSPASNSTPQVIFFDDFETDQGWVADPSGSDTATTGTWKRANPRSTDYRGPKQLGETTSGSHDLVTGPKAGNWVGKYDVDGGVTSIRSPDVTLPDGGELTLSFHYYLSHYSNASSDDYLRVKVVGETTFTVFEELGAADDDDAAWATFDASLDAYAGQTIYLLIEAADGDRPSLVEAAVDDVRITVVEESPSGVIFFDDFETDQGWVADPSGSDTATTGTWKRANPQSTDYQGPKQLGEATSGSHDLVTGPKAGNWVGKYDVDGGVTSIRSPDVTLPDGGELTLSFHYYLSHYSNASSDDYLRVKVVGETTAAVFEELGAADDDDAAWATFDISLNAYAGQTIYLLIEAADGGRPSLVEAAVDDVRITVEGGLTPVAGFTAAPLSGPAPLTVVFTNTTTGEVTDYEWGFGDGGTSAQENPTHVYAVTGTYTVSLTATGPGGSDTLVRTNYIIVVTESALDSVRDYAILGLNSVWLRDRSELYGGHVGVQDASSGLVLDPGERKIEKGRDSVLSYESYERHWYGPEVSIERNVTFHDPTSAIAGDTVKLGRGASVFDIYYNELKADSDATHGQLHTPLGLPLVTDLPTFPEVTPGSTDYDVRQGGSLELPAGAYGEIRLRNRSVLTLTGGVYHLADLKADYGSRVWITGPAKVRIAGRLKSSPSAIIGPAPDSGLDATDLIIFVEGINGKSGHLWDFPKAATVGHYNVVTATIYAPNGTLWLRRETRATGAFIGRDVLVDGKVQVWLESGFAVNANFTATPRSGSAPLAVTFSNASTPAEAIETYVWDFGDGGTSAQENPTHVYAVTGTYTVSLTATGPGGSDTLVRTNYIAVTEPISEPVVILDQYAAPWLALAGDVATYTLVVTSTGTLNVENGVLVSRVPQELDVLEAGDAVYDDATRELRWELGELDLYRGMTKTFQAQITDPLTMTVVRSTSVFTAEATSAAMGPVVTATTMATLLVGEALTVTLTPDGGELTTPDGRVRLIAPRGAVTEPTVVRVADFPLPGWEPGEERWLALFDVQALGGEVLREDSHTRFLRPLTVTVDLTGQAGGVEDAYWLRLEDLAGRIRWPVETATFDPETEVLTATLQEFSGSGAAEANPLTDGSAFLFKNWPQTDLYSGAATYGYPIETPPGRNGMGPNLSLGYNSRGLDGIGGIVQSSDVGLGWSLGGEMKITRGIESHKRRNGEGYKTRWEYGEGFKLMIDGASYRLIEGEVQSGGGRRYYTEERSGLLVMRYNPEHGYGGQDDDPSNESEDYWVVTTPAGTAYRFGFTADAEQMVRMEKYRPDAQSNYWHMYGKWGQAAYAGEANDEIPAAYRLDRVRDVHGNTVEYHYYEEKRAYDKNRKYYDRGVHLKSIEYGGNYDDDGTERAPMRYRVEFVLEERRETDEYLNPKPNRWHDEGPDPHVRHSYSLWEKQRVHSIQIQVCTGTGANPCTETSIVREYVLKYRTPKETVAMFGQQEHESTLLKEIHQYGEGGGPELPVVRFTYEGMRQLDDHVDRFGHHHLDYHRLIRVENGYGGWVRFVYEDPALMYQHRYSYRVKEWWQGDGRGNEAKIAYEYNGACFSGKMKESPCRRDGQPKTRTLMGHDSTVETVYDYGDDDVLVRTTHHFHNDREESKALGREKEANVLASDDNSVLQTMSNTWETTANYDPNGEGIEGRYNVELAETKGNCSRYSLVRAIPGTGRHNRSQRWHLIGL